MKAIIALSLIASFTAHAGAGSYSGYVYAQLSALSAEDGVVLTGTSGDQPCRVTFTSSEDAVTITFQIADYEATDYVVAAPGSAGQQRRDRLESLPSGSIGFFRHYRNPSLRPLRAGQTDRQMLIDMHEGTPVRVTAMLLDRDQSVRLREGLQELDSFRGMRNRDPGVCEIDNVAE